MLFLRTHIEEIIRKDQSVASGLRVGYDSLHSRLVGQRFLEKCHDNIAIGIT